MIFKGKTKIIIICIVFVLIAAGFIRMSLLQKIFYPYPYRPIIEKYAYKHELDPLLVIAIIREESRFKPNSYSPKGAIGLMQLMPETAKEIAAWLGEEYESVDLKDPNVNIRYGTWYLAALKKEFSGNILLVLAAYNAGSGRVKNWLESTDKNTNQYLLQDIPVEETRDYVEKVLYSYKKYAILYGDNKEK